MRLFESILWTPAESFYLLDYHLERMGRGADFFGFSYDSAELRDKLFRLEGELRQLGCGQKVRLFLSKNGSATLDYQDLLAGAADGPLKLCLAQQRIDPENPYIRFKTSRRDFYTAATPLDAACNNWDDLIFLNVREELCESTRANLVLQIDGRYYTPPTSSGLLPGTYRRLLIETGTLLERPLYIGDLRRAEGIFLINSVRKWMKCSDENFF